MTVIYKNGALTVEKGMDGKCYVYKGNKVIGGPFNSDEEAIEFVDSQTPSYSPTF